MTRDEAPAAAHGRRLAHSSIFGLGLKAAGILMAWGSQLVIARLLGVEAFGIYVTAIAWVTILALAGGLGMPIAAVRFLAVYAERADWAQWRGFVRTALALCLASSLAIMVLALGFFAAVPSLREIVLPLATTLPMVLLLCLSGLCYSAFLAGQMPLRADGLANAIRPAIVTALIAIAWLAGAGLPDAGTPHSRATWALALTVAASAIILATQAAALRPLVAAHWRGPAAAADRKAWLAAGLAGALAVGAMALMERLDTILLSAMLSPAEAGPYSVVSRLALLVSVALNPLSALLGPMGAQFLTRGDHAGLQRVLGQGALLSTAIGLTLALAMVLLSPLLLGLFGRDYLLGRSLMAVMVAGQAVLAMCGPAGGILAMAGRNREMVIVMLASVTLHAALCLVLIPAYGMMGAASATTAALSANGIGLALTARRLLGVNTTIIGGIAWLARRNAGAV